VDSSKAATTGSETGGWPPSKKYYETAELAATTDPNLVFDLRAKLDAAGHYDDFEVERVVAVELDPRSKQADLAAAIDPVRDRLVRRFNDAQAAFAAAHARGDEAGAKDATAEMDALVLFKGDLGAYLRLYTFLSQIFDYGTTAVEKRAIFYKALLPLLEFGRERETIDLSRGRLTHYALRAKDTGHLPLAEGPASKLEPLAFSTVVSKRSNNDGAFVRVWTSTNHAPNSARSSSAVGFRSTRRSPPTTAAFRRPSHAALHGCSALTAVPVDGSGCRTRRGTGRSADRPPLTQLLDLGRIPSATSHRAIDRGPMLFSTARWTRRNCPSLCGLLPRLRWAAA
jgi:hypothetical protein